MDHAYQRYLRPRRLRPLIEVFQRAASEGARVGGGGWFWAMHSTADVGEGGSCRYDSTGRAVVGHHQHVPLPLRGDDSDALDFAAITGLRVGGEPIPYDPSIDVDDAALRWFLGRVPRHSRVRAVYDAGLFDWGGATLWTLYCFLGAASRGVGDTIGGYWRVIELWAYEVLGMFPPENTCTNPHLLPRELAWGKEYRRTKERRGQVMTFRRWLDNITGVHWDRWARLEADFLPRSREVTRS
ncbi:hypothetical protein RHMOL_Rhmol01G0167600 [Rhododendron molle]|uniref:Uncharacterized protein n=1 Tax=Rhododendron molle TaxID=49168 RepID=A0ACC0Q5J2_RHOML|nr:hypothetical protein RHMOL_Rhmol01G0167600 [Rhododendron molle]